MVKSASWGLAVAALLATSPVWAELKIGYVNYGQLLQSSPQAKAIAQEIRAEFLPRQKALQTESQELKAREARLKKNAATMSEEQRDEEQTSLQEDARDLQRKQSDAQDDFNAKRNEELSRLQKTLIREVQSYAKAQNFDLVLANGVIYANSAIDITPAILTVLKKDAPKTAKKTSGKKSH